MCDMGFLVKGYPPKDFLNLSFCKTLTLINILFFLYYCCCYYYYNIFNRGGQKCLTKVTVNKTFSETVVYSPWLIK